MAILITIVSYVLNALGSFATDGNWKTAGLSVAQVYWKRARNKDLSLAEYGGTPAIHRIRMQ